MGALPLLVSETASRKEPLTADHRSKGPGKTMAFRKARWNLTVSVKALRKADPTEAESLSMGTEKVQTMTEMR
jgi:hypothetical protein